ncbi:hypothetical protein PBY51_016748 [Eleginops maclovinus]|uniref:Uncharacterized protein n=1 Tax=Eleginops maclovinus TaxID=56733 RepID=A0AAN7W8L1_ELEMC|nr:hypothetical protein PBY51_016748 [Eleginops maclovinus]
MRVVLLPLLVDPRPPALRAGRTLCLWAPLRRAPEISPVYRADVKAPRDQQVPQGPREREKGREGTISGLEMSIMGTLRTCHQIQTL